MSTWKNIINDIDNALENRFQTVQEIAVKTGLEHTTVTSFLPFSNFHKEVLNGNIMYRKNDVPKKIPIRSSILVVMELLKNEEKDWLTMEQIIDNIVKLIDVPNKESIKSQVYQLYSEGKLSRRGFPRNYIYSCTQGCSTMQKTPIKMPMADKLMEVLSFVEKAEAEIKHYKKENAELQKKLDKFKKLMGEI